MKSKYLIYLLIVVIIGVLAVLMNPKKVSTPSTNIHSFEECAAAGNPVMESYPRQCNTPDGKHFVETVVPEP
jgi:hypothetical protein